jgi:Tfp pilus assembly protein PilX
MKRNTRRPRGWIMLAVLGLLLLVTMIATGLYTQSEQHLFTTKAMAAQQVAVQRAEQGFQIALQGVRASTIPVTSITQFCNTTLAQDCPTTARYTILPVDNGTVLGLSQGGGLQYQYYIIRRNLPGTPVNRYVIQSVGFYGFSGTPNIVSSIVEGDVDVGTSNPGGLSGGGNEY